MTKQAIAIAAAFLLGMIAGATCFGATPAHAVTLAAQDLATLPEERRPFTRYAWIVEPSDKQRTALMLAVNQGLSHAATPVTFTATANGRQGVWFVAPMLARLDLSIIGGSKLALLGQQWENLVFVEPYFHELDRDPNPNYKPAPEEGKPDTRTAAEKLEFLLPAPASYLPVAETGALIKGCRSNVPIVRADWLVEKALSTINGNRYYQFRGIDKETKLNDYLKEHGVNVDNLTANRKIIRTVVAKRQPTKSPGAIVLAPTTDVSPTGGLVSVTFDMVAENRGDPEFDPERNLFGAPKFDAAETIVTQENGQHEYALWNGKGELQNEAPQNAAADATFLPHDLPRLFPAMSCINCHGQKNGWLPIDDRIRTLLSNGVDVLADFSRKEPDAPATFDKLAGLYLRPYDTGLDVARNVYADSVFLATGGQDVATASAWTSDVYREYASVDVTAEQAAIELGLGGLEGLPKPEFNEDVKRLNLRARLPINRRDWEQVYAETALIASGLWFAEEKPEQKAEPEKAP